MARKQTDPEAEAEATAEAEEAADAEEATLEAEADGDLEPDGPMMLADDATPIEPEADEVVEEARPVTVAGRTYVAGSIAHLKAVHNAEEAAHPIERAHAPLEAPEPEIGRAPSGVARARARGRR
jgi:hypothetical protein